MIEFGKTLRAAREAKGLSVEQLAKATCMLSRVVNDLENENFSRLPAPIYGRGFVKLYCEQVGLDPKPMIAEFMEILNGRRDDADRGRSAGPAASAAIRPGPVRPAAAEPAPAEPEPATATETTPDPAPAVEPAPADDLFSMSTPQTEPAPAPSVAPKASRYAAAYGDLISDDTDASWAPSPSLWRWAVVTVAAIAFLALVALGLRALYHATSSAPEPIDGTTAAALGENTAGGQRTAATGARTKAADEPRTPMDIPSLYID